MSGYIRIVLVPLSFLIIASASAQWVTQEFELQAGWNSIYLSVQPEPDACDAVVADGGVDIDQIMTYNSTFTSVQFIQDISEAQANDAKSSEWLRWGQSSNTDISSVVPALHSIRAGRSYLIYANHAGTWRIQGRPIMKAMKWRADRLNLVGFEVDAESPPVFSAFFADCNEVDVSKVYRMGGDGIWDLISDPSTATMKSGEAFWIQTTNGVPNFNGPVSVSTGSRLGLDYGKTLMELPLQVLVEGAASLELTLTPATSEINTNDTAYGAYAGDVPLMWWNPNASGSGFGNWEELTGAVSLTLSGDSTNAIRIAAVRRSLANPTASASEDPIYSRLIHVGDGKSLSMHVPVQVVGTVSPSALGELPVEEVGLWVGSVVVDAVCQPYPVGNPGTHSVAAGSEYSFRILLHCSSNGVVHMLSHAVLAWEDGEYGAANGEGFREVAVPGHYRIIGTDDLLDSIADASTARRISTSNFSHQLPLESIGSTTNSLRFMVHTPHDDPRSPYLHSYHPMHDSRKLENSKFEPIAASIIQTNTIAITNYLGESWGSTHVDTANSECFSVTRSIDMAFEPISMDASAEWGTTRLGGEWNEVITGLHSQPLAVRGHFILNHISASELEF